MLFCPQKGVLKIRKPFALFGTNPREIRFGKGFFHRRKNRSHICGIRRGIQSRAIDKAGSPLRFPPRRAGEPCDSRFFPVPPTEARAFFSHSRAFSAPDRRRPAQAPSVFRLKPARRPYRHVRFRERPTRRRRGDRFPRVCTVLPPHSPPREPRGSDTPPTRAVRETRSRPCTKA